MDTDSSDTRAATVCVRQKWTCLKRAKICARQTAVMSVEYHAPWLRAASQATRVAVASTSRRKPQPGDRTTPVSAVTKGVDLR